MNSAKLNSQQKRIVETGDGPFMVVAGPGTGKTKTLTSRIAYLIANQKIGYEHILTLTFTKRAAAEMRERLKALLGKNLPKITTFHGFAFDFLNSLGQEIQIITEQEQEAIIKKIVQESSPKIKPRDLSLIISQHKSTIQPVKKDPIIEKLILDYQKALIELQLVDFDDLLLQTWQILQDQTQRKRLQQLYKYVLIDEFQDTNDLQYQIIKLILNHKQNLFVIGDPLQSIYGFRGANSQIFETLKKDFPNTQEAVMEINYRSKKHIVQTSNQLFANVQLKAASEDLGRVAIINTLNEFSEAEWIVNFINQKIGGTDLIRAGESDNTANLADFAIIYRTHDLGRVLEDKFLHSGLPFQIVKEDTPVQGDHIKLLSMHAAKGLEFKYVFVCGFEEGLIPYEKDEEERKLFYVAITRAKDELYLLQVKKRHQKDTQNSSFKKKIMHENLLEMEDENLEKTIQKRELAKIKKSQISLF